jgi:hypothetical protein
MSLLSERVMKTTLSQFHGSDSVCITEVLRHSHVGYACTNEGKSEVLTEHQAMKAYWGGGIAPRILD